MILLELVDRVECAGIAGLQDFLETLFLLKVSEAKHS